MSNMLMSAMLMGSINRILTKHLKPFLSILVMASLIASCGSPGTVIITVVGSGTVEGYTLDELVFNCEEFCNFNQEFNLTLIAKPEKGAQFLEWRGAATEICSDDPLCILDSPRENVTQIIAVFSNADSEPVGDDTATTVNSLFTDEQMLPGDSLKSKDGNFRFFFQRDGNLVLRDSSSGKAAWSSKTDGDGGTSLYMQDDGNLVLYTSSKQTIWKSNTDGSGATRLTVNNSGRLALYAGKELVRVISE